MKLSSLPATINGMRLLLCALILCTPFAVGRIIDLEDREGRKITVDVIALKDGIVTFRRTDTLSVHHFPEKDLSDESIQRMHTAMTENLSPKLTVTAIERSRKSETHWRSYWGSYDKTIHLKRIFNVNISSTSAFQKEVLVYIYWFKGEEMTYEVWDAKVGGDEVFDILISESGKRREERWGISYSRWTYSCGPNVIEPVVVIKDKNRNVISSWANLKNLQDVVLKNTNQDPPRPLRKFSKEAAEFE